MTKELWKKCECGIVIDSDEKHCPVCDPDKKPKLELVELDDDEIRALVRESKIWTKHPAKLEKNLF